MTDRIQLAFQPPIYGDSSVSNRGYWKLLHREHYDTDDQYELRIARYWDGETWDHFSFYRCDYALHDPVRLITAEDHQAYYEYVEENEGEEEAIAWLQSNDSEIILSAEEDIKQRLIKRWQAVCELVHPSTTF